MINFNSISLKIQFKFLRSFYHGLIKFYRLILKKESTKEKKTILFDNASQMYNTYLENYFD